MMVKYEKNDGDKEEVKWEEYGGDLSVNIYSAWERNKY
jgi:hypothetical protein